MSSLTNRGSTTAWRKLREAILIRDGYQCAYCGAVANTVDHLIPRDAGGTDDTENLISACAPCNRAKSNKVGFFERRETPRPHLSRLSPTRRLSPSTPFSRPDLP